MFKVLVSLAILSCVSVNCNALGEDATAATSSAPTEVGTTTLPAGQYSLIEQNTGKKYSLMVTTKGTMICGPVTSAVAGAAAAPASKTNALESLAKSQMEKSMGGLIQKQGINEFKSLIK